jgi:hypothetical protein
VLKDAPPVVATAQEEDNDEAFSMEFRNILKEVEQLGVWLAGWLAGRLQLLYQFIPLACCTLELRANMQDYASSVQHFRIDSWFVTFNVSFSRVCFEALT